jgi:NAD(P)-dependent dehydrogenase (short-subunit alcohol dehydrogenase family)
MEKGEPGKMLSSQIADELHLVARPVGTATDYGESLVRDNATVNQQLASQTPFGRVGQPEDIGALVAVLLSQETYWVNGQRIEAAGGLNL